MAGLEIPIQELLEFRANFGEHGFCARYPHPFLLPLVEMDDRIPEGLSLGGFVFQNRQLRHRELSRPITHFMRPADYARLAVFEVKKRDQMPEFDFVTVGRNEKNDIVLPNAKISKVHAAFSMDAAGWHLFDVSSNGTYVEDQKLAPKTPTKLADQAIVYFGQALGFHFMMPDQMALFLYSLNQITDES